MVQHGLDYAPGPLLFAAGKFIHYAAGTDMGEEDWRTSSSTQSSDCVICINCGWSARIQRRGRHYRSACINDSRTPRVIRLDCRTDDGQHTVRHYHTQLV